MRADCRSKCVRREPRSQVANICNIKDTRVDPPQDCGGVQLDSSCVGLVMHVKSSNYRCHQNKTPLTTDGRTTTDGRRRRTTDDDGRRRTDGKTGFLKIMKNMGKTRVLCISR